MSKIVKFWVDCEYDRRQDENADRTKFQLLAEILREFEEAGHAMRYLNSKSQISWKATPRMLTRLADAEQEAREDSEHDLV
jgi:predicted transcriptional regulator